MPNGRGRFSYSRFGGFSGYGADMGDPAASAGGQSLTQMTQAGAPRQERSDPLWDEIESTFQDILGQYANLKMDMPVQPPDMGDPNDQLRYLKDLEALGMGSSSSAALMGANLKEALAITKYRHTMQKDQAAMIMKLLPTLDKSPEIQAMFAAQLLNMVAPGQFDVGDKSFFGGFGPLSETPGVTRLTPETATEGMLFESLSASMMPKVLELAKAKDKEGIMELIDAMVDQLTGAGVNETVAITIGNKLYADAIGRVKAEEPVY